MGVAIRKNRYPRNITIDKEYIKRIEQFAKERRISFSEAVHFIFTDYFQWIENKQRNRK